MGKIKKFDLDAGIDWFNVQDKNKGKRITRRDVGLGALSDNIEGNAVKMSRWQSGLSIPNLDDYFSVMEFLGCPKEIVLIYHDEKIGKAN